LNYFKNIIKKLNIFYNLIISDLLSLRNAKERPSNPSKALIDYFGEYKDASWDEFDRL
jgi:hypothetical protein